MLFHSPKKKKITCRLFHFWVSLNCVPFSAQNQRQTEFRLALKTPTAFIVVHRIHFTSCSRSLWLRPRCACVCVCVFQCTFPFVKLHMFAYKMLLTNECVDMRSRKDKLQSVFVSSQICAEASVLDQVLDTAKHKWAKDTKTTDTHSKNKTQRDRRE